MKDYVILMTLSPVDFAVAGKLKAISAPSRFTPAAMRMAWS